MKPIKFPEQNKVFTKPEGMTDEECLPLPVFTDRVQTISCWQLTPEEKMKVVFFGKIWLSVYGGAQPPVWLSVEKTVFVGENMTGADFIHNFKLRRVKQFLDGFEEKDFEKNMQIILLEFLNFLFSES